MIGEFTVLWELFNLKGFDMNTKVKYFKVIYNLGFN